MSPLHCIANQPEMETIITTHKNTDFDAIASMVAATLLYPEAKPLLPKPVNPNVKAFLSLHKDIFPWLDKPAPNPEAAERLVIVDTAQWERLTGMATFRKHHDLEILLWDHHTQPATIHASWMCQAAVGANITLMMRCLKAEKISLSPIQATLFLAGLYEDTGQLTFTNTTAEDAYAAAYLLEHGADLKILSSFLRPAYGEKQKNILFEMLKHARREKINGHAISISRLAVEGHIDSLALVVGMYRDIMNVDAAFGIFCIPDDDRCMVIGRSDVEDLNIGDIMRGLGGGGHPGAGSAMLRQVNPDVVSEMICGLISGNQQSSVQISDLMSFPVHTISPDATMEEAAKIMRVKGCTGLPVAEDDKLLGMISRRDFVKVRKDAQLQKPVKAFMRQPVMTIDPGKSPLQAARIMIRQDIGRLPVVEDGRLIGIVTRSDVMCYFYDLLPE
ncbi:MAG: CBS domain-containing protein [Desulfobacteraceae bacterium]|nr:CBS domain-containing protein [Desulfobacteraceae bacterium]